MVIDVAAHLGAPEVAHGSLSDLAQGVVGSQILRIAAQIRAAKAKGAVVCDLTVGDFDPRIFPIPEALLEGVGAALAAGHTNYPPSDGVLPLRESVARFYERELGVRYPVESVLITGGARPLLYGCYKTLLDPGDSVVYALPSWNNNHYAYLAGAKGVGLPVGADSNFFPTAAQVREVLDEARMLVITSPANPTGTVIEPDALRALTELVVEENQRRQAAGRKGLWLVFDQVYCLLTFGGARHVTPVGLVPEAAPYTVMLDAISKSFAATGLRVGWAVAPPAVRQRMADVLGHVGAWAPKAEQMAVANLLDDAAGVRAYLEGHVARVRERLDLLASGFREMAEDGYPVEALSPQGAIYLSVRIRMPGMTNEDVRRLLLEGAGFAVVPFQAFGLSEDTGWFRLSVGAVTPDEIRAAFPRLREVLPRG